MKIHLIADKHGAAVQMFCGRSGVVEDATSTTTDGLEYTTDEGKATCGRCLILLDRAKRAVLT